MKALSALDACDSTMDLHPPMIEFASVGDLEREDSRGRRYFIEDDDVILNVSAYDWDRGPVPVEYFVNGEPLKPGQKLEGLGIHFVPASSRFTPAALKSKVQTCS